MNILIVCEKFAPENTVGAIRMTKVAKYLKLNYDCNITVLLRERGQYDTIGDSKYVDQFIYAKESLVVKHIMQMYKGYSSSERYDVHQRKDADRQREQVSHGGKKHYTIRQYLKSILAVAYSEITPRSYCRNAVKQIIGSKMKFDVIISSFGPSSSHYIGKELKRRQIGRIWIADFRDPLAIGESTKGFLHKWAVNFSKRVCGSADAYTVASNGFVKCLNIQESDSTYVITNGFDVDDFSGRVVDDFDQPHEKMRLVYTGTLFPGTRDISVVFRGMKELIEEGKVDRDRIEFIYAGQHKSEFLYQFEQSGINVACDANDIIPKQNAIELQQSADVLLVAAWNTQEYQGSLPLKLYEYMYTHKPIVCSVCGTSSNSEIKHILDQCAAGVVFEEASKDKDYAVLKEALLEYYHEFLKNGYVPRVRSEQNEMNIGLFDYKYLTNQFVEVINTCNERLSC